MVVNPRIQCLACVCAGLFGTALLAVVQRFLHPAFLASDFARGFWQGVCIGVELLGLLFLKKGFRRKNE